MVVASGPDERCSGNNKFTYLSLLPRLTQIINPLRTPMKHLPLLHRSRFGVGISSASFAGRSATCHAEEQANAWRE